ncbi:M24 family metallopeptidase [Paenibacillus contaminans]|uniref:Aminopeptidase P family protein n=1 Tax=Paenibacillus contaminans TaxID=450362 RepID=A0A329MDJ4_9BACL|nr:Xaa-Pro peptidase family protein [Paenibacillus contaminans]RAV16713.1 aminopeptidase P family protein [Paenibacillus contaminans]
MVNYLSRLQKLQEKMQRKQIDGFVVTQNVDIYYFTGTMQTGYLFIPAEGEAVFYVRRSIVRAQEESAVLVEELGSMRSFGERLKKQSPQLFEDGRSPILATEYDVLPVQVFERLRTAVPNANWTDGSLLVRETRMIKSPAEIAKIKEAAHVIDIAYEKAVNHVKEGMHEFELMSMIELTIRLNGHAGLMRMRGYNQELITGMVGSGAAAAMPTYFDGPAGGQGLSAAAPQSSSRKKIGQNEPVLVDIGCNIDGYVIDQTRTLVIGELSEELTRAYVVSERILRETEALLKPGTICEELYANALRIAREEGLADHFMGYGADQVKFLGHGIGLEIDELPVLAKGFTYPLEPGMVIAIEPKFTFPGVGVVGIEDSYAITESGFEKLTVSRDGITIVKP